MTAGEWIAGAALAAGAAGWIANLIRKNDRLTNDVNRMGQIMRDNDKERQRDYLRLVAFQVEHAVPGRLGEKLGKLIRRDRID